MLEATLGYKSAWRILGLFAEAPRKEFDRAFLKEQTLLGNQALDNALLRLAAAGVIISERGRYRLDLGNERTKLLVQLLEQERGELRHLDYRLRLVLAELLRKLFDTFTDLEAAYLFGSHARGTARPTSDIDVALLFTKRPDEHEIAAIVDWIAERFAAKLQAHAFSAEEFARSKLSAQILDEGIRLT